MNFKMVFFVKKMPQMTKETTLNEFNDSNALNEIHEVEEKMKISTAEIKIYIIECVKTYGMYTNDDFKKYIIQKSGKIPTKNQIAGAIAQLVDSNDISRVGRGLYSKDIESTSVNTKASSNNAKEDTLKAEIYNTLSKVEKELVSAIGSVNVFDLNSENFEIIKKIRGLKDTIEEIKGQCK